MKKLILVASILFVGFAAFSRNVQQSECVGPANAPVKAIYMHGWFPASGAGGWYSQLEADNRVKLEALAKKMNIRIAIPVAKSVNGANNMRQWDGNSLSTAETAAKSACGGSALAVPRALIGFSSGGYMARNVALACDAKTKSSYSAIVMIGAKPRMPSKESYAGCPKFVVMAGKSDGSAAIGSASSMTKAYEKRGGDKTSIVTYPGGHIIPDADLLSKQISSVAQASPSTTPAMPPMQGLDLQGTR